MNRRRKASWKKARGLVCIGTSCLLAGLAMATCAASPTTNGIFADFVTSMGNFTCSLDYTNAPKAVASFMGLAAGQQTWVDFVSGRVRTNAFYSETTFHRVIEGFMIQGGSRNAMGTDGPGYAFVDEFTSKLRFDHFGVLAMANSGPDSNGAQFFITVAPTAWLNDLHTIFGQLVSGSNVVAAISHVDTDSKDKPLTNVVVQQVIIRRVGAAAEAFNMAAQDLPMAANQNLRIVNSPAGVTLSFTNHLYADNKLFVTSNFWSWSEEDIGLEVALPVSAGITRNKTLPHSFFTLAQVQYPSSTFAPKTVTGRTLTLNITGSGTLVVVFDATGGGTYTFGQNSGVVESYDWEQKPYNATLWPIEYSELIPMTLKLNFDKAAGGTFSGTAYPSAAAPFPMSGSFTLSGS